MIKKKEKVPGYISKVVSTIQEDHSKAHNDNANSKATPKKSKNLEKAKPVEKNDLLQADHNVDMKKSNKQTKKKDSSTKTKTKKKKTEKAFLKPTKLSKKRSIKKEETSVVDNSEKKRKGDDKAVQKEIKIQAKGKRG